jgi:hypothetical protein
MTSTDSTSSGYISRMQARSIIASIANRTRPGPGVQSSIILGQIDSVLNAPLVNTILPPTDFSGTVFARGNILLRWSNNATGIIDTRVEQNINDDGWEIFNHSALGTGNSITLTFLGTGYFRVSSVTATGISVPSISLYFVSTYP